MFTIKPGITILQAVALTWVEILRFCYHDRLSITGNCRLCLVEVEKSGKSVKSVASYTCDCHFESLWCYVIFITSRQYGVDMWLRTLTWVYYNCRNVNVSLSSSIQQEMRVGNNTPVTRKVRFRLLKWDIKRKGTFCGRENESWNFHSWYVDAGNDFCFRYWRQLGSSGFFEWIDPSLCLERRAKWKFDLPR